MTFAEKYNALEDEFCAQVKADKDERGLDSEYVSNTRPDGPVDFVLIAMEPSKGIPRGYLDSCTPPLGFAWSTQDFILHHCVRNHLCGEAQSYHITDLSKGAMGVDKARRGRRKRYERWFPLLKSELELVAKPGAKMINIGSVVRDYLSRKKLCEGVKSVLHYSPQASGYRKKAIEAFKDDFPSFRKQIDIEDFIRTVDEVLRESHKDMGLDEDQMKAVIQYRLKCHRHGPKLEGSESRKMLMFYYKKRFEELREDPDIVLKPGVAH